jgi:hypothetical protein
MLEGPYAGGGCVARPRRCSTAPLAAGTVMGTFDPPVRGGRLA